MVLLLSMAHGSMPHLLGPTTKIIDDVAVAAAAAALASFFFFLASFLLGLPPKRLD